MSGNSTPEDTQAAQLQSVEHVTSKTPTTKQKNPKRVAESKAIAMKTKEACEEQKKVWLRLCHYCK